MEGSTWSQNGPGRTGVVGLATQRFDPAPGPPGGMPRRFPAGCRPLTVGYISDFQAVEGASVLFDQKRAVDAWSARGGVPLDGYRVDSGRADGPSLIGPALRLLMAQVRAGAVAVVVVQHVSRFAPDLMTAYRAAVAMVEAGAEIHEAMGGRLRVEGHVADALARSVP